MFISPADRLRFVLAAEALGDRPADRPPSPDHPVVIRGGEGDKWWKRQCSAFKPDEKIHIIIT